MESPQLGFGTIELATRHCFDLTRHLSAKSSAGFRCNAARLAAALAKTLAKRAAALGPQRTHSLAHVWGQLLEAPATQLRVARGILKSARFGDPVALMLAHGLAHAHSLLSRQGFDVVAQHAAAFGRWQTAHLLAQTLALLGRKRVENWTRRSAVLAGSRAHAIR